MSSKRRHFYFDIKYKENGKWQNTYLMNFTVNCTKKETISCFFFGIGDYMGEGSPMQVLLSFFYITIIHI